MRHRRRPRRYRPRCRASAPYSPSPCASVGELPADMRATVITAIGISRRNRIGARLTPQGANAGATEPSCEDSVA